MAKKKETNTNPKRRTQVKELPKEEKQLSKAEQKKIKGGPTWAISGSNVMGNSGSGGQ